MEDSGDDNSYFNFYRVTETRKKAESDSSGNKLSLFGALDHSKICPNLGKEDVQIMVLG